MFNITKYTELLPDIFKMHKHKCLGSSNDSSQLYYQLLV